MYYFEEVEENVRANVSSWPPGISRSLSRQARSPHGLLHHRQPLRSKPRGDHPCRRCTPGDERWCNGGDGCFRRIICCAAIQSGIRWAACAGERGIGPKLPRPNHVRVPTRRELASYGIKLPSQRMAEERARKAELNQAYDDEPLTDEEADALEQDELARQFAATQQQRYGEVYAQDEEDDSAAEAELARQFAASQQQRYSSEQPQGATPFSPADYDFSPMKALVDDGPSEPLFTPMPETQPPVQQYQQPVQRYQQPAQSSPVQQPYQQPVQPVQPPAQQPQPAAQSYQPQQAHQGHMPQQAAAVPPQDSLIHPPLMRNGNSQPMQRPTTPPPSLDLLTPPPSEVEPVDTFALEQMARLVEARLADFRIKADVVNYSPGPVITRFELNLAPGVKAARISNLSRDLARSLSTIAVRVVEVIPGKPYVGLELPNKNVRPFICVKCWITPNSAITHRRSPWCWVKTSPAIRSLPIWQNAAPAGCWYHRFR